MSPENYTTRYHFWSGSATLRDESTETDLSCHVYQEAIGKKELIIECEVLTGGFPRRSQDLQLDIPGLTEYLPVFMGDEQINSSGQQSFYLTTLRTPCWFSKSQALRSGRACVVNFAHYWMGHPNKLNFALIAGGWKAEFISITKQSLELPRLKDNDEFQISHQIEFSREDGSPFKDEEAQDLLLKLSLFLSFCRGQWVGCSLTVGLDSNGEMALEQWGTGRTSSWCNPNSWLDLHHGYCIRELYEKFIKKLQDETWIDAVSHVVYWFARAQTNNVGPDGACILLQAALERLAWHVLVRERKALSEKGFRDLTAADQLRLMLNILSIPLTIPEGLEELKSLGRSRSLDGPGAFTFIRNRFTHPPKVSAPKQQLPSYEAYCLAQWYVELAILSACGYNGEYSNRTKKRRWVGQVELVPWA